MDHDGHRDPRRRERGASAMEYALLIALVAAIVLGAVWALGQGVVGMFGVDLTPAD